MSRPAAACDAATLAFYEREAERYVAAVPDWTKDYRDSFLARLQPGAHILDLGCGGGRDAAAMIAAGFTVDATDGSAAMAAEAEKAIGRKVRVLRFDELDANAAYDAVWASASLLHVPRGELGDALVRVHRALKSGGLFYASFKAGDEEGYDEFGRYYNYPDAAWLRAAYATAGPWEEIEFSTGPGTSLEGGTIDWHFVTMRKPTSEQQGTPA